MLRVIQSQKAAKRAIKKDRDRELSFTLGSRRCDGGVLTRDQKNEVKLSL
jgi:hypothetical protein